MATGIKNTREVGNKSIVPFYIGRVKEVVLSPYVNNTKKLNPLYSNPSDIGKIQFEKIYSNIASTTFNDENSFAFPMFSFVKQYPLVGEIVAIFNGPSHNLNRNKDAQELYYLPPYSIWQSVNQNIMPNLRELAQFFSDYVNIPGYNGGVGDLPEFPKGYTFTESTNVRPLTPFEGDSIIEGRFGQSIRFGSTVEGFKGYNGWSNGKGNGSPITIIRNGQGAVTNVSDKFSTTVEDINTDKTSIYLTSNQSILIDDLINFPLRSYGVSSNKIKASSVVSFPKVVSTESTSAASQDNYTFNKTL